MQTGDNQASRKGGQAGQAGNRPPGTSGIPNPPDSDTAHGRNAGEGSPPAEDRDEPHVTRISREDAERKLAPDPDPDDPVSP